MGLLDQLWGDARNLAGQQEGQLPQALLSVLGGGEGKADQANGLTTLIAKFQQAGLGSVVQSWISNDRQNESVSPDQVHKALGEGQISSLAQQTGLPKTALLGALAEMLPKLIDSMTPNGQAPTAPDRAPLQNATGNAGGAQSSPDQEPGEAEAPGSTSTDSVRASVNRVDPTEPTDAETEGNT